MTDKKPTDAEIKKALEWYVSKFKKVGFVYMDADGTKLVSTQEVLDLINRQEEEKKNLEIELKAMRGEVNSYRLEVERLQTEQFLAKFEKHKNLAEAKAESYKEFAEKMNKEAEEVGIDREGDFVETQNKIYDTIADWCKATSDNLLKELVGEDNGNTE